MTREDAINGLKVVYATARPEQSEAAGAAISIMQKDEKTIKALRKEIKALKKSQKDDKLVQTFTSEKDCVWAAENEFRNTHKTQLILRKKRKYIFVDGETTEPAPATFKNAFGQTIHKTQPGKVLREHINDGWELRGWVNERGSFKNN